MILSACQSIVPATSPPQLSHTPGASLTITDNHIDAGWFTLDFPDGWRVVTNIAIEPLHFTLVSPDDEMFIIVEVHLGGCSIVQPSQTPGFYSRHECRENLFITATVDVEFQATFHPAFDLVIDSIDFR